MKVENEKSITNVGETVITVKICYLEQGREN